MKDDVVDGTCNTNEMRKKKRKTLTKRLQENDRLVRTDVSEWVINKQDAKICPWVQLAQDGSQLRAAVITVP
jgi:hypothetical protein